MEILAYCGIYCNECPIYISTKKQNKIDCSLEKKKGAVLTGLFTAGEANCYGCSSFRSDANDLCARCEVRRCAQNKGIENCGLCNEYPCDLVEQSISTSLKNRKRLDEIAFQKRLLERG